MERDGKAVKCAAKERGLRAVSWEWERARGEFFGFGDRWELGRRMGEGSKTAKCAVKESGEVVGLRLLGNGL